MKHNLQTRIGSMIAYADMYLRDHQLLRIGYLNVWELGSGAWRSAQPSRGLLRGMHRRHGIRTVINLRGPNPFGSYAIESATCDELGMRMVDMPISSRLMPTVEQILRLRDLFESVAYPVLIHCKAGADRAGLASSLYRHFHLGEPIAQARRQLHWKFGHFNTGKVAILDFFFDAFERETADGMSFIDWVKLRYDPARLQRDFSERPLSGIGSWLIERLLRRE